MKLFFLSLAILLVNSSPVEVNNVEELSNNLNQNLVKLQTEYETNKKKLENDLEKVEEELKHIEENILPAHNQYLAKYSELQFYELKDARWTLQTDFRDLFKKSLEVKKELQESRKIYLHDKRMCDYSKIFGLGAPSNCEVAVNGLKEKMVHLKNELLDVFQKSKEKQQEINGNEDKIEEVEEKLIHFAGEIMMREQEDVAKIHERAETQKELMNDLILLREQFKKDAKDMRDDFRKELRRIQPNEPLRWVRWFPRIDQFPADAVLGGKSTQSWLFVARSPEKFESYYEYGNCGGIAVVKNDDCFVTNEKTERRVSYVDVST